jgi:hypothetical protein
MGLGRKAAGNVNQYLWDRNILFRGYFFINEGISREIDK